MALEEISLNEFDNVWFGNAQDNDAKTGSKGDYSDRDNCGRYAKTFAQANQFFDEECVNPIDPPPFTVFIIDDFVVKISL